MMKYLLSILLLTVASCSKDESSTSVVDNPIMTGSRPLSGTFALMGFYDSNFDYVLNSPMYSIPVGIMSSATDFTIVVKLINTGRHIQAGDTSYSFRREILIRSMLGIRLGHDNVVPLLPFDTTLVGYSSEPPMPDSSFYFLDSRGNFGRCGIRMLTTARNTDAISIRQNGMLISNLPIGFNVRIEYVLRTDGRRQLF